MLSPNLLLAVTGFSIYLAVMLALGWFITKRQRAMDYDATGILHINTTIVRRVALVAYLPVVVVVLFAVIVWEGMKQFWNELLYDLKQWKKKW